MNNIYIFLLNDVILYVLRKLILLIIMWFLQKYLLALKSPRRGRGAIFKSRSQPSIPVSTGVIMKDLVSLETAIKDHIEHETADGGIKKLVNFHKMVQISNILNKVTNLRSTPPNVVPDKDLTNIMRVRFPYWKFSRLYSFLI